MRATTGRAISATIHQRLKEALARGEPTTYQQLASHAGCTVRSVRNYLANPNEIFGFDIEKSRDESNRVVLRAKGLSEPLQPVEGPSQDSLRDVLADAFIHALFPNAGVGFGEGPAMVALRGFPAYGVNHREIARRFVEACQTRSTLLRLLLRQEPFEVILFPASIVVHSSSGVILVGTTQEGRFLAVELIDVRDEAEALEPLPGGSRELLEGSLEEALDLPFCWGPADEEASMTEVHVRFDQSLTNRLRHCVWHRGQRVVLRRDGELDVRFGPVPLRQAASWAASFGAGVRVLGGKKLRKMVKKGSFLP